MSIIDELETMRRASRGASITRFNDGELGYAYRGMGHRCQRMNRDLRKRLREVFRSEAPGLLVCVPRILPPDDSLPVSTRGCQRFWPSWRGFCGKLFDEGREYGSGFISYPDRHLPRDRWAEFRGLCDATWAGGDVVVVGNPDDWYRRRGMDSIRGHASLEFVAVPPKGVWRVYDETLEKLLEFPRHTLMLVATGVTGTVLAHDLHLAGFQALDIGRLPIRLRKMEKTG